MILNRSCFIIKMHKHVTVSDEISKFTLYYTHSCKCWKISKYQLLNGGELKIQWLQSIPITRTPLTRAVLFLVSLQSSSHRPTVCIQILITRKLLRLELLPVKFHNTYLDSKTRKPCICYKPVKLNRYDLLHASLILFTINSVQIIELRQLKMAWNAAEAPKLRFHDHASLKLCTICFRCRSVSFNEKLLHWFHDKWASLLNNFPKGDLPKQITIGDDRKWCRPRKILKQFAMSYLAV